MNNKVYMCIDLKSFYASVECIERGLDPLTTNLVVADKSRTEKTICLAVTPSLKKIGVSGRVRLFELNQKVKEVNKIRKEKIKNKKFREKSYDDIRLINDDYLELDYIIAPPRMSYYMDYSTKIYNIYLKYLSRDDIYVYSIDEVFCDITNYLKYYDLSPRELVTKIIKDVYDSTGITATAGIGTNMFLAKVAMDVVAKHTEANEFGVRIAELDEMTYRKKMWNYKPMSDIWRIGKKTEEKLNQYNMYTMGDVARKSINDEDLLYKLFGINAELIIDHAWGYEPCNISDIKGYKPQSSSISQGQVLHMPYDYYKTKIIIREMADLLALDLVDKKLVTDQIVLTVGYDIDNLIDSNIKKGYSGEIVKDRYGRSIPKHAHGTINLDYKTSSSELIMEKAVELYDRIINKKLLVRRINIVANKVIREDKISGEKVYEQYDLFTDYEKKEQDKLINIEKEKREKEIQKIMIDIKKKYGKNSIIRGMNLQDGATTMDRNRQIGGHHE